MDLSSIAEKVVEYHNEDNIIRSLYVLLHKDFYIILQLKYFFKTMKFEKI